MIVSTYGSGVILLSCALSDEVAGIHTLLDLWCSLSQTLVQIGCAADIDVIHCRQEHVFALLLFFKVKFKKKKIKYSKYYK